MTDKTTTKPCKPGIGVKLPNTIRRRSERGNVFFTLFGAVAVVGVLGAGIMATMRGPLSSMVNVQRDTQAKAEMSIAAKLVLLEATDQTDSGDCDADGFVEPLEYNDTAPQPIGGGQLPTSVGSNKVDPWGTPYGYCGWNAGGTASGSGCGSDMLAGNASPTDETYTIIAIISAGPDKTFQTTCTGGGTPEVTKTSGSDDLWDRYNYQDAAVATGGLWNIKSGDPDTAEINKKIEVAGEATFNDVLNLTGAGAQLQLGQSSVLFPTQATLQDSDCDGDDGGVGGNQLLLRMKTGSPPVLQVCDNDGVGDWVSVAAGANLWQQNGTEIYYEDFVGIGSGMTNPTQALDVAGNINLSGGIDVGSNVELEDGNSIVWTGDIEIIGTGGAIEVMAGGGAQVMNIAVAATDFFNDVTIKGTTSDDTANALTVNDSAASDLFIVQNDGDVGIGVADPNDALDVSGSADVTQYYAIDGNTVLNADNSIPDTILVGNVAGANVTGDNNTVLGGSAGATLTSGTDNILVGSGVDVAIGTWSDYMNLGNLVFGDLANKRLGIGFVDGIDVSGFDDTFEVFGSGHFTTTLRVGSTLTLAATDFNATGCSSGQLLKYDGSDWTCSADAGSGSGGSGQNIEDVLTVGNDAGGLNAQDFGQVGADSYCDAGLADCTDANDLRDANKIRSENIKATLPTDTTTDGQALVWSQSNVQWEVTPTALNDLALDATINATTCTSGETAVSNGAGDWVCGDAGDLGGTPGALAIDDLTDAAYDTATDFNLFIGHEGGSIATGAKNNTVVGYTAFDSANNANADNNAVFGYAAMTMNTSGSRNAVFGYKTSEENTIGNYNAAFGSTALRYNKAKDGNSAFGYQALHYADSNTTSAYTYNSAFGYRSMFGSATTAANTGALNTAYGALALSAYTSGGSNVAVGYSAGDNLTTASRNILLGASGVDTDGTDDYINIGNAIYGDMGTSTATGTNDADLIVDGSLSLTNNLGLDAFGSGSKTGTEAYLLAVEADGDVVEVGLASVGGAGVEKLDDLSDVAYDTVTTENLFIGHEGGGSVPAGAIRNVGIGIATLDSIDNALADENTALGYNALTDLTSGLRNSAFGSFAGQNITSGDYNMSFGSVALTYNETGSNNVAIGYQAARGPSATNSNISNNTVIGYQAGYNISTGANDNILIGYQTGDGITTGSRNILMGSTVEMDVATNDDYINIGNAIYGDMGTSTATGTNDADLIVDGSLSLANNLGLDAFGSGSKTGTEAYLLAVEADGDVVEVGLGSVGSSSTYGTDNQVPYVNATDDDFDYSANYTFTGTALSVDNSSVVFNDSGADVDFKIEGDTDANLFYVDASTDRVGIGTNTPEALLQVHSDDVTQVTISGGGTSGFPLLQLQDDEAGGSAWNLENGREGDGILGFYNGGTKLSINSSGKVGIGVADATNASLEVQGNTNGVFAGGWFQNVSTGASAQSRVVVKSDTAQLTMAAYSSNSSIAGGSWADKVGFFADTNSEGLNFGSIKSSGGGGDVSLYTGGTADSNIRLYVGPTGNVGINETSPGATFDVDGTVRFQNMGAGSITGTPTYLLAVEADGDVMEIDIASLGGSSSTYGTDNQVPYVNATGDDFDYSANYTFTGTALSIDNSSVVFNDSGVDVDYRIEGVSQPNLFFVDADKARIGIGTSGPLADMQIGDGADAFVSPEADLYINNNGRADIILRNSTDDTEFSLTAGTDSAFFIARGDANMSFVTAGAGTVVFDAGSGTDEITVDDGEIAFAATLDLLNYGSGSNTGTPTYLLAVEASGDVMEVDIASLGTSIPADSLDFDDFTDTMALDASTSITADGTEVLSVVNTGTGNSFLVEDVASDTTPFVIDADGNVAIGTTTATGLLTTRTLNGTTNEIVLQGDSGSAYAKIARIVANRFVYDAAGNTAEIAFYRDGSSRDGEIGFGTNPGSSGGQEPTERMRIDKNGRVGIGTGSPGALLDVDGTVRFQDMGAGSITGTPTYLLAVEADGDVMEIDIASLGGGGVTADSLDFDDFTDTMALDASTSITADGTEVLSVVNTGTGNSFLVEDVASDTTPFVIDAAGQVGVGTPAPKSQLNIVGTYTDTLGNENAMIGLGDDGANPLWGFQVSGAGTGYDLQLNREHSSTAYNVMTWDRATGRVGVGTVAPATDLEVKSITADPVFRITNDGTATYDPTLSFYRNASDYGLIKQFVGGGSAGGLLLKSYRSDDAGSIFFQTGAGATNKMVLDEAGALNVAVYGSGSITGTPTYLLAVEADGDVMEVDIASLGGGGVSALDDLSDVAYDPTTDFNLFIGSEGGGSLPVGARFNTATGVNALDSINDAAADGNTAYGHNVLTANTTGGFNTGYGYQTLKDNTTGAQNVAFGIGALESNKINTSSTAIGYYANRYADDDTVSAAATFNVALGYFSLYGSTTAADNTGIQNTALGSNALFAYTSGGSNVAVGFGAGDNLTTANRNILLGASGIDTDGTDDYLNIGNAIYGDMGTSTATGSADAVIMIDGKLGVGVSPTNQLDVKKDQNTVTRAMVENASTGTSAFSDIFISSGSGSKGLAMQVFGTNYSSNWNGINLGDWTRVRSGSLADGLIITTGGANHPLVFGTADTQRMIIDGSTGDLQLKSYGAGSITGTPTYLLAVEADGDVMEIDIASLGGGAVTANSLDFDDFTDTMSLDASTSITADGAEVLSILNTGTGNSFLVEDVASDTTPFVIDSTGSVGVGISSPDELFHMEGGLLKAVSNGDKFAFYEDDVAEANAYLKLGNLTGSGGLFAPMLTMKTNRTASYGNTILVDNAANDVTYPALWVTARTNNSTTTRDLLHISNHTTTYLEMSSGGVLRLNDYGGGSNSGTPTYLLAVEADGDVMEVDIASLGGGGVSALNDLSDVLKDTTTDNNLFIGHSGGSVPAGAQYNTGTGIGALASINNATADNNTAYGYNAGQTLTEANNNVLLGYNAGLSLETGTANIFIGSSAGADAVDSTDNVLIGMGAGEALDGGSKNIALGGNAGGGLESENRNILIGDNVDTNTTDDYLNIGNAIYGDMGTSTAKGSNDASLRVDGKLGLGISPTSNLHTYSNNSAVGNTNGITLQQAGAGDVLIRWVVPGENIIMGIDNSDGDKLKIINGAAMSPTGNFMVFDPATNFTGIGTDSPGALLDVDGTVRFQDMGSGAVTGTPTYLLAVEADGDVMEIDIASLGGGGASALNDLSDAAYDPADNNNLFIGHEGGGSVPVGAINNIALGLDALDSINGAAADNNIGIGSGVLTINTTGSDNTAVGSGALNKNSTGTSNTAFGYKTLGSNDTNIGSTAFGYQANMYADRGVLGVTTYNVAVGYEALRGSAVPASNTGGRNTAIGGLALHSYTSGGGNVAVGYNALNDNTTGGTNVAIGSDAMASNTEGSQNIAIGGEALISNLDGGDNIALGFTALENNEDGNNNIALGMETLQNNDSGNSNTVIGAAAGLSITSGSRNIVLGEQSDVVSGTGNDQLAIGNSVGGDAIRGTVGTGNLSAQGTGWNYHSDERLKKDIRTVDSAVDDLQKIRGVLFKWNEKAQDKSGADYYGVIAQEVQAVFPDMVNVRPAKAGDPEYLEVNYTALTPVLIEAAKELADENDVLKGEITDIRASIDALRAELQPNVTNIAAANDNAPRMSDQDILRLMLIGFALMGALLIGAFVLGRRSVVK